LPGAHSKHEEEPGEGWCDPGLHAVQLNEAALGEYWPAAQAAHDDAPAAEYRPAGHAVVHTDDVPDDGW
jgi:hypothetical protein